MKLTAKAILARWRVLFVLAVIAAVGIVKAWDLSNNRGYQPDQPIPFSHRVHAGNLGLDCLYCHSNAEKSRHATVPPLATCMGCHNVVRTDREPIQAMKAAYDAGEAIPWVRIHSLPDHVYFSHAVHVGAGVACQECHGPIQEMEIVKQQVDLSMGWCIECHRNDQYLRTPESIALQKQRGEFAHSAYRLPEPGKVDADGLEREYRSLKDAYWSAAELDELSEGKSPEEVAALVSATLGYDSLAPQQGPAPKFDHVRAFENANVNCNTCHQ